MQEIKEGSARLLVPEEKKISKKLPVFYNPVMKFNRDMSVLLLKAIGKKNLKIGLPLTGTGIRGIRFLKEIPEQISYIFMNDNNPGFIKLVSDNLKLNAIKKQKTAYTHFLKSRQKVELNKEMLTIFKPYNKQIVLSNTEANLFMLCTPGFDYIDIDPFGTPNPFLDSACMRLARDGILAVTATDTSALCGTYIGACKRKYWAIPMHNEIMHEVGLRILIRKVQLIGAQYEKALIPVFSYSKEHYMRIFFRCDKGKARVDEVMKLHDQFEYFGQVAGPLWLGNLGDPTVIAKMFKLEEDEKMETFLKLLHEEAKLNAVGFLDIHTLCKRQKINDIPSFDTIFKALKSKKIPCSRTHFSPTGLRIRIEGSYDEFLKNKSFL
ncbi:MAG: hypothetical protein KKG59_03425 [Nanoarchaeota archaeon]|nr:hypothetical protein [Nanoarchaeota archaeon]